VKQRRHVTRRVARNEAFSQQYANGLKQTLLTANQCTARYAVLDTRSTLRDVNTPQPDTVLTLYSQLYNRLHETF